MVKKTRIPTPGFINLNLPPPLHTHTDSLATGVYSIPPKQPEEGRFVSNAQGAIEVIKRPCRNCIALSEERGK